MELSHNGTLKRVRTMLAVDIRRMLTSSLLYIMLGVSLVMPILVLVMTTMMDGSVSVNPQTGVETVIEGFDNVWQIIGTVSGDSAVSAEGAAMDMSITAMCNINLLYFVMAVLACIFVADDFRSGYAKNLFTVRAKKSDYVISKTLVCSAAGALMLLAFFLGSMLGGAVSGLPFEMVGFGVGNLILCILSKMALVLVFVPMYVLAASIAKSRLWLSIMLSAGIGMLMFMMIPMLTPLNAGAVNLLGCLAGGALFSVGLGAASNAVLLKTSLV